MAEGEAPGSGATGLRRQVARGAAATVLGQALRILLQTSSLIVLARLLAPREFGLVAGVLALVGIAEVFRDFGLSTAGMQAPSLSRQQRSGLFWGNAAVGLAFSLLVVVAAPLIGRLYGDSALVPVARVLALTFAVNGLAAQYRVDLLRRLRFARVATVDVAAQATGLVVAVLLAVRGAGHWALVGQQLVQAASALLLVVAAARWLPGHPRDVLRIRGFLRFGGTVMASQVFAYVGKNVDNVLVGARVGLVDLGIYSRAYSLVMTPLGQLRAPTTNIAVPVLARLQDDQARYDDFLRRGQLALGYGLVGLLAVAAGAAGPLVEVLLGPRWTRATPLVALLAYAGAMETLPYVAYWVYVSRGLVAALLRFTVVSTLLRVTCIAVGSSYGPVGVAAGFLVGTATNWPISLWRIARVTTVDARTLVLQGCRVLALALATTGVAALVGVATAGAPSAVRLVAALAAGLAVYVLGGLTIRQVRQDLRELAEIAHSLRVRRGAGAPVREFAHDPGARSGGRAASRACRRPPPGRGRPPLQGGS